MSSRAIWIPNRKYKWILNSREEKHLSGAVGWAWTQAAPSSEAEWIRIISSGGSLSKSSSLHAFEEKSENMAWSFLGLPTKALIDSSGTAALELMAIVRRRYIWESVRLLRHYIMKTLGLSKIRLKVIEILRSFRTENHTLHSMEAVDNIRDSNSHIRNGNPLLPIVARYSWSL